MSRWEFMRQLEELLSDISPNEREEALQYYNDYFNDAGREQEASVIEALGSPEQVAMIVKDGLGDGEGRGEFTENGFQSASEETRNEVIKSTSAGTGQKSAGPGEEKREEFSGRYQEKRTSQEGSAFRSDEGQDKTYAEQHKEEKKEMPTWAIVLIVIACLIFSPVILGVLGSVLGVLFGIVVAILALVFGFGLTALILFVVAASLLAAGIGCMVYSPIDAIGLIGGACICGAVGILAMLVTVWITGKGLPAVCRGISYCYNRIFRKKGE